MYKQYLQYVKNTGGFATKDHIIDDFDPIGGLVWGKLHAEGLIMEDENGRIHLTDKGKNELLKETT